jgi:hypothetical protein
MARRHQKAGVLCVFLCVILLCVVARMMSSKSSAHANVSACIKRKEYEYNRLLSTREQKVHEIERLIARKQAYIDFVDNELLQKENEIIDLKAGKRVQAANLTNGGGDSDLNEDDDGYITKKYNSHDAYRVEKQCYLRLKGEPHFANLVRFDDEAMTLTLSQVGKPVTAFTFVPNFKTQITQINAALDKHNIQHNDIHLNNILIKEDVLYLIDFEWAEDKSQKKEWQAKRGHFYEGCDEQHIWIHQKRFPDPDPYSIFQEYIENTW